MRYTVAGRGDAIAEMAQGRPLFQKAANGESPDLGGQTEVHAVEGAKARTRGLMSRERETLNGDLQIAQTPTLRKSSTRFDKKLRTASEETK